MKFAVQTIQTSFLRQWQVNNAWCPELATIKGYVKNYGNMKSIPNVFEREKKVTVADISKLHCV